MNDTEWSDITVKEGNQEKVEYEIEGQEAQETSTQKPEEKEEVVETASENSSWIDTSQEVEEATEPKELEGVETKGAQKRIRQIVKQRKERDEKIQTLIQQNEQLNSKLFSRENEFTQAQGFSTETS